MRYYGRIRGEGRRDRIRGARHVRASVGARLADIPGAGHAAARGGRHFQLRVAENGLPSKTARPLVVYWGEGESMFHRGALRAAAIAAAGFIILAAPAAAQDDVARRLLESAAEAMGGLDRLE